MPDTSPSTSALGGAREVWEARAGARTRGDAVYIVYVAVLGVLVLGIPVARLVVDALARPDVLPVLLAAKAPEAVTAAWLVGCGGLVLAGGVRGPAVLSRFFTATLASSAMPRRRALARPFVRSALAVAVVFGVLGVLVAATLDVAGHASTGDVVLGAAAWAGAGLVAGCAWLLGEIAEPFGRRAAALVLAAAGAVVAVLPAGGGAPGPGAALAPHGSVLWACLLVAAGVTLVVVCVPCLDRLRGRVLAEQAARSESASLVATSGDLAGAAGTFRALPTTGRRLGAVRRRGARVAALPFLYLRRDLVALARTPERTVLGLLAAIGAGAVLTLSPLLTGPVAGAVVLVGALALWLASSSFVDGMRHGVETLGAPALFGQRAEHQVVLHALGPLLVLELCVALGGVVAVLGGGDPGALGLPLLAVAIVVLDRLRDAAKGPLPVRLTMPMPTPQGDPIVLLMLAWQLDALLLALALVGAIAVGLAFGLETGLLLTGLGVVVLVLGIVGRLAKLRS